MGEMKWYVIRCSSGQEKKVKKYVDNEIIKQNVSEQVSRIIIPTRKEVYLKKGKKVSREVNFYPGYVLIEADLNKEVQHIINETTGVLNILGTKDKSGKNIPEPLRENEVLKILGKIDDMLSQGEETKHGYVVGESVTISEGPFASFIGIIEDINEEKKRIKVSIKIFDRKTPVDLDFSQIMKI
jgi:transcriptional antiterminator NusG